jgi:protoporphyrinogen oxidase
MDSVEYLVVGAGVTGLSFSNWIRAEAEARGRAHPEVLVLEAAAEPGGYCKTIAQDGFVWDYSGHFFHFKHPEIEAWLRARMPGQNLRTVNKRSFISYGGQQIDFPFQKNIHQLAQAEFIECLHDPSAGCRASSA